MTTPRISVLIDTYNHERYIEQAIVSVLEQDFPAEDIDATWDYTLERCPDCRGPLDEAAGPPRIVQQVEIVLFDARSGGR